MFKPSAGLQGIKDFILETVETAGPNPCPPMVVGVGIGGTFDKCALLAKKALMRPLDSENPDPSMQIWKKRCWRRSTTGYRTTGLWRKDHSYRTEH
jgi:tartrate/fumarate subfamily iron-sulfur-dependent hydro-lyase alpha chain